MDRDRERGRRARMMLAAAGMALVTLLFAYSAWEKPPEQAEPKLTVALPSAVPTPSAGTGARAESTAVRETEKPVELPKGEAIPTSRRDGIYTVLLAGSDNGNGNTDTIILGRIDTKKHAMDFVSIPRDTIINVDWGVKRINAAYWGARNSGGDGIEGLKTQVSRLAGFVPDCCAVLDLQVFMDAVDLIGGVSFDVPMAMDYEDAGQELYIHLEPGLQVLDGYSAMCLCRFRSGYITADLGRIDMQQQFLRACADQLLELGSIPKAPELLKLLAEGTDTDLSPANMAFLLRQFLSCRAEDICFHQAPCDALTISGCSYILLQPEPWLELVNSCLNPYEDPIGGENLDLIYRAGNGVACTGVLRDPGYFRPAPAPAPAARPAPAPEPEEDPAPEETEEEAVFPLPEPDGDPEPEASPEPGDRTGPIIIVVGP